MVEIYYISLVTYLGFIIQLCLSEIVFSQKFFKRNNYLKRHVTSFAVQICLGLGLCFIFSQIPKNVLMIHMLMEIIIYSFLIAVSIVGLYYVYRETIQTFIFCVMAAYAVQHLMSQAQLIVLDMVQFKQIFFGTSFYYLIIYLLGGYFIDIIFLIVLYIWFAKKEIESEYSHLPNNKILLLSCFTIVLLLVLSCTRDYYQDESVALTVISRLFSVMCCVFLLLVRAGFLEQNQLEREVKTICQLNHQQHIQFEQSRQNIELINIKCHDMKKRIEQFEDRFIGLTPEEITEMKNIISIYDKTMNTGNITLDIILTERSLICERENIVFSCIVDGESLNFFSKGDIYSLFANAIDNAMEAVSKLQDKDNRIISLSVRKLVGMVAINVDNYCETNSVEFQGKLPRTTKNSHQYHGFGLKSIQLIVKKYDGEMSIHIDEMFHLSILIPMQNKLL